MTSFPEGYPDVVTGALSPTDNVLVTGHSNGMIVKSDLVTGARTVLHQGSPTIRSIALSPKKEVVVGTASGLLMTFQLDHPSTKETLRDEDFTVNSRVWKTIWLDPPHKHQA